MLRELTMPKVVVATVRCLFAMGTARAADSTATECKNEHRIAIVHADADYRAANDACEPRQGE
jgi:hypothetical protein